MFRTLILLAAFGLAFFDGITGHTLPNRASSRAWQGDLKITFIGNGTLMFEFGGKVIHVDPWGKLGDYSKLPKAVSDSYHARTSESPGYRCH